MYFQVYQQPNSTQWRWRLLAENHKIIADSAESYWNKSDCYAGIALVKQSWNAPIYET